MFADDVAVDWINDKLYWVDSLWARIEVMDISDDGMGERAQIVKMDIHTLPRGIAIDPISRSALITLYVCNIHVHVWGNGVVVYSWSFFFLFLMCTVVYQSWKYVVTQNNMYVQQICLNIVECCSAIAKILI